MLRNVLHLVIFALGLAAALWIGAGYVGHHATGAAVAFLIAAVYCVGGAELLHFQRGTRSLAAAASSIATARENLPGWLQHLPSALRGPVALRVQGARAPLPAPALTPYLVGLLVLLGMLGTLLGMMATLRGTGVALQAATDLQAIRGSLASPVEGLAVAFGTSIAGVAASAMLGLLSALLRRDRQAALDVLDAQIGSELQVHGDRWQRGERLRLLQDQAGVLPSLVQEIAALSGHLQQASREQHAALEARQQAFIERQEAAQLQLAQTLEEVLQRGVASGSAAIGETLQPWVRQTMDALYASAQQTHQALGASVQQHLAGVQAAVDQSAAQAATRASEALQVQREANAALAERLRDSFEATMRAHQTTTIALHEDIQRQREAERTEQAAQWQSLLAGHDASAGQREARIAASWAAALDAQQAHTQAALAQWQQHQQAAQAQAAEADAQRLQAWATTMQSAADQAAAQWQQHADAATARQERSQQALEDTALRIGEAAREQSEATVASITTLLASASDAPRAAAEVIGELRQRLSDSLVRDTALLDERAQLLGTLGTMMDALQAATTAQREAVDQLIERAGADLQQASTRFGAQVDAQAAALATLATGVTDAASGSRELASSLEGAVAAFNQTADGLSGHLQSVGAALDASLARSDEQLAYYVAQAREVVDLSLLSQKQITEELRQLGAGRGATART